MASQQASICPQEENRFHNEDVYLDPFCRCNGENDKQHLWGLQPEIEPSYLKARRGLTRGQGSRNVLHQSEHRCWMINKCGRAEDTWVCLKVGFQPFGIEQLSPQLLGSCLHRSTWLSKQLPA